MFPLKCIPLAGTVILWLSPVLLGASAAGPDRLVWRVESNPSSFWIFSWEGLPLVRGWLDPAMFEVELVTHKVKD